MYSTVHFISLQFLIHDPACTEQWLAQTLELVCFKCAVIMCDETHQVTIIYRTQYTSYSCGSLFMFLHVQFRHWLMLKLVCFKCAVIMRTKFQSCTLHSTPHIPVVPYSISYTVLCTKSTQNQVLCSLWFFCVLVHAIGAYHIPKWSPKTTDQFDPNHIKSHDSHLI